MRDARLAWTAVRLGAGFMLAGLVFVIGYVPGDTGRAMSPCQGADFTDPLVGDPLHPRSYGTVKEDRLWPPGSVCRGYTVDGRLLRVKSYPESQWYWYSLAAFVIPLLVPARWARGVTRLGAWCY
jgi:hypothetical protein